MWFKNFNYYCINNYNNYNFWDISCVTLDVDADIDADADIDINPGGGGGGGSKKDDDDKDSKKDDDDHHHDEIIENNKYSFNATYLTSEYNEFVQLINPIYEEYIINMTIDSENFTAKTDYYFESIGIHKISVLMDISMIDSIEEMFSEIDKMISISFTTKFNSKYEWKVLLLYFINFNRNF